MTLDRAKSYFPFGARDISAQKKPGRVSLPNPICYRKTNIEQKYCEASAIQKT